MRLPQGPKPYKTTLDQLRLFGQIRGNTIEAFTPWFQQYGDMVLMQIGGRYVYLISNPEAIYEILVTKNQQFYKGTIYRDKERGLARFLGNGLLTSDGEFWKRQRKLVAPALHTKRIAAYAETMVDVTEQMLDHWHDQGELDVDQEMMHATMQIVAKSLFNAQIGGTQSDKVGSALTTLQHGGGMSILPNWIPTPKRMADKRATRDLDEVMYAIIADRRRSNEDYGDLLSM